MLIYADAGKTKQFKYFIFTNVDGKVLGYKLNVTKALDKTPEIDAIVAALYWVKLKEGRHTIFTDFKSIVDLLYVHIPSTKARRKLKAGLQKLVKEANAQLVWVPRTINVAGKVLEKLPRKEDADGILKYLRKGK